MSHIDPNLPRVIREALEAYATHVFSEDQGSGPIVVQHQNDWIKAEKKLKAWLKRQKTARVKRAEQPIIYVNRDDRPQ